MFKLSRITDLPRRVSRPGAYQVPDDLDLRSLARSLAPAEPTATAAAGHPVGQGARAGAGGPSRPSRRGRGPAAGRVRGVPRSAYADLLTRWPRRSSGTRADVVVLRAGRAAAGRDRSAGRVAARVRAADAVRWPAMTSQAQVRRLLSLVPYLREHDGVAMTDVAAAFGISVKTLRDDLNVLWMCGMPGLTPGDLIDIDMDAVDGEGVIHLSNADYLTRPLRLSADEALALVLALRTLREIAGPGKRDGDRPGAGEARGGGRQRAAPRRPGQRRGHRRPATRSRPGSTTGCSAASGSTSPTTWPPGPRRPGGWSTRCGSSCWRGTATSRPGAISARGAADLPAGPDRRGRGDRHRRRRRTTCRSRICPPAGSRRCRTRRWSPWSCSRGRPGSPSTTRPRRWRRARRRRLTVVTLRVTDPAWLRGLLLRLGGGARVVAPPGPATRPPRRPRRRWTSTRRSACSAAEPVARRVGCTDCAAG